MNVMIRLNNMQYLQVLEELLFTKIKQKEDRSRLVNLPLFNLISLLVNLYTSFIQQKQIEALNLYILHYFIKKHRSEFEVYRHMLGMIHMWKKYLEGEPEARLFLSVLNPERSQKQDVKLFLKIRKSIVRTVGPKLMQDVELTHQDLLTLSHTIFTSQMKNYTSKKIHELFLALRKKSIHSNKINGAVACEFLLNCAEKYQRQELDNIKMKQQQESSFMEENQVYTPQRFHKPINNSHKYLLDVNHPQLPFRQEMGDRQITGVFRIIEESPSRKSENFLVNNLEACKQQSRKSLSPQKALINEKYSYSWQKFLKTNQETKQKLLKPHQ